MTTLISWMAVDSRKPASLYIASDSRLSWGPGLHWDRGRKVFSSKRLAHIWGYCGDVVYPSLALGQIITAIDNHSLLPSQNDPGHSHNIFFESLQRHYEDYPAEHKRNFSILHCQRIGVGMELEFFAWQTEWTEASGWTDKRLELPRESGLVIAQGSGATPFEHWNNKMKKSEVGGTSRAVFQALSLALKGGGDIQSGGAPQLVGLWRQGPGLDFAVHFKGTTWLNGMAIQTYFLNEKLECFNELFERCDPVSGDLLGGTQRQPVPKNIH